jgi:glycosyltransferase involved in cell wall biosynthesis
MRGTMRPLLQYVFMAWCLVKHRDFTFTLMFIKVIDIIKIIYLQITKISGRRSFHEVHKYYARLDVFTAMKIQVLVFWIMTRVVMW